VVAAEGLNGFLALPADLGVVDADFEIFFLCERYGSNEHEAEGNDGLHLNFSF
jgi:hypothetical protein